MGDLYSLGQGVLYAMLHNIDELRQSGITVTDISSTREAVGW